jgi:hypothetical protein
MRTWLRSLVNAVLGKVRVKLAGPIQQLVWRWTRISAIAGSQCPMGCAAGASEMTDTSSSRLARRRTLTHSRS